MKSGDHAFIFSLPQRNITFTFTVNPEQIAKMGPKKRARKLEDLAKQCGKIPVYQMHDQELWQFIDPFMDFAREVYDFAASGIGEVK